MCTITAHERHGLVLGGVIGSDSDVTAADHEAAVPAEHGGVQETQVWSQDLQDLPPGYVPYDDLPAFLPDPSSSQQRAVGAKRPSFCIHHLIGQRELNESRTVRFLRNTATSHL